MAMDAVRLNTIVTAEGEAEYEGERAHPRGALGTPAH